MDTQGSPLTAEHYGEYLREFAEGIGDNERVDKCVSEHVDAAGLNVEYDSEVQMLQSAAGASGRCDTHHAALRGIETVILTADSC